MKNILPVSSSAARTLVFAVGFILAANAAQATIWRVDNNPGNPGNYTTAQAAHDGAAIGDTLYFTGSGTSYGNITITKKLYLFGPGYFLTHNPETQANINYAALGTVLFNSGSSGSLMTGLVANRVDLNTSNLVVKRNYISGYQVNSVQVASGLGNIMLLQNYIIQGWYGNPALSIAGGGSNIQVRNNYIANVYDGAGNYPATSISSAVTFANNVVAGTFTIYSSNIFNNILRAGSHTGSSNSYSNNIGNSTQFGSANGNQQNVVMTTVFLGGSSSDGQFQLKAGSPAIGAGLGGATDDIGMFGGSDPYVLSGLPAIPAIWFFNGPATGSGPAGLPVHVKVKSHN